MARSKPITQNPNFNKIKYCVKTKPIKQLIKYTTDNYTKGNLCWYFLL